MEAKERIYQSQLSKYCKLASNEKIFVIDEAIIRESSSHSESMWGAKNKARLAKAWLLHWNKEIRNYNYKIKREITTDEIISLQKSIERYQSVAKCILGGWQLRPFEIEKIDILEDLISDVNNVLFEEIEFKKKGYIQEKYSQHNLAQEHVVTVIESETHFTIKEIYIPYSGIIIQLPTK
jgi:hypothetical protein